MKIFVFTGTGVFPELTDVKFVNHVEKAFAILCNILMFHDKILQTIIITSWAED